jgi:hypothetical protein
MGLKLSIDNSEIINVTEKLVGIKLKSQDISDLSPLIRLAIQEDVDFRFQNAPSVETGGEVWGGEYWRELSADYLAANPIRLGGQILRDTGELQQSLTSEGHPYNVFEVTNSEVVFGTALLKASRLQRDRPFIFWHPKLLEKIATLLVEYLNDN